jgi:hypothetical protein
MRDLSNEEMKAVSGGKVVGAPAPAPPPAGAPPPATLPATLPTPVPTVADSTLASDQQLIASLPLG